MSEFAYMQDDQPEPTYLQLIAGAVIKLQREGAGIGETMQVRQTLMNFCDQTINGGVMDCGRGVVVRFPPKTAQNAKGFRGVEVVPEYRGYR